MKTSLLLIGFSLFTLCTSVCPVSMLPAESSSHHHHAHMHGDHDEDPPCERCESSANDQLACTPSFDIDGGISMDTAALAAVTATLDDTFSAPQIPTHLAMAGPIIRPNIVSTIVLRT